MIEERLKTRPLPPPPAQAAPVGPANLTSEHSAKARDGDSDADIVNHGELDKWTKGSFVAIFVIY